MRELILTPREPAPERIDLSHVRLEEIIEQSPLEISRRVLSTSLGKTELGEVFQVEEQSTPSSAPALVLRGQCQHVHALGHQHRVGLIRVEGDIGDYCGACMSGGTIRIEGNAGHHLAAPTGSRGVGMNGGLLTVGGSAGDFAGHRMRRGEIRVAGDTGSNVAAWQIAGSIFVGGSAGTNVAYGMRRGTLVLTAPVQLPANRFTAPLELKTPFQTILLNRADLQRDLSLTGQRIHRAKWTVSRGDRSIGGIGEVWMRNSY